MKVTVFGATGGIGGEVVRQLLDAGNEVTAVLRQGKPYAEQRARFAVVPGLADPRPLVGAIRGADAVISAVGPRSLRDGPVASTATKAILRAMDEAGVHRLVAVSATPVISASPGDGALLRFRAPTSDSRRPLRPLPRSRPHGGRNGRQPVRMDRGPPASPLARSPHRPLPHLRRRQRAARLRDIPRRRRARHGGRRSRSGDRGSCHRRRRLGPFPRACGGHDPHWR